MTRSLRALVLVTALTLGLALAGEAAAGAATEQLRSRVDRVVGILDDDTFKTNPAARREALRTRELLEAAKG